MSAKTKLRSALSAIDDAIRSLKRAKNATDDDTEIRKAIHKLENAKSDITRAVRDLPDE